ncbi:hypothetical protein, partial [Aquabacterium sp.]|uniref:hypothetical protein n=1 Tax=Aquabacterium sp. TaxID=1872578 RepID=UPI0025BD42F6
MRAQLPYLAFMVALTLGLYLFLHLPLGFTALAVFVGWPLAGTLITADDDLPGGWGNSDGSVPPPWKTAWFWGQITLRLSFALSAFAIEAGVWSSQAWVFWLLCVASGFTSFALLKR